MISGDDNDAHHRSKQGLAFEVARQLTAAGHQVWMGARDEARGQQAADTLGVGFVQLDVTDDASVAAATETVAALDVLVNNAGISGGRITASEATVEHMRTVYDTNVFGPFRLLRAFIPLLENSPAPVVVNVSSRVGSLSLASDPESPSSDANFPVYSSSKAALNMLTIRYAAAFRGCGSTLSIRASPRPTSTTIEARKPSSEAPR